MKKLLLPVFLLLVVVNMHAQKDSVRKYLDADLNFTTKNNAVYAAMAFKSEDHWLLYAVYPDTSVLLTVLYKDAGLTIKDGAFTLYQPKRIVMQKGFFRNNVAEDHWQSYYPGGRIKEEGDIMHNHFSGVWRSWYENGQLAAQTTYLYQDSVLYVSPIHENSPANKVQRVLGDIDVTGKKEGPASAWYENGNKESVTNYHHDSLSGLCSWYRSDGKPSSVETYTNGKVTDLECYDEEGRYSGATCSILKQPVLIHPVFDAVDYIENELHKQKRKGIINYGDADVTFTVTKKGVVQNLVITSSPDAALNRYITEIFKTMPAWSPAVTHNRLVDYPVRITIPYYGD